VESIVKKTVLVACVGLLAGAFFGVPASAADVHSAYSGGSVPAKWGALAPGESACGGKTQSPISQKGDLRGGLKPILFSYRPGGGKLVNNGHMMQMDFASGSSIVLDGITFELKQLHFHTPSENRTKGKSYPMEAHLVHADKDGHLAVVVVMIEQGAKNPAIAGLWLAMLIAQQDTSAPVQLFSAAALLPEARNYDRFKDALTTLPRTECVRWVVMKQPIFASAEQVAAFATALHASNGRLTQAINARVVLE
jgi:carbonic anhydrase